VTLDRAATSFLGLNLAHKTDGTVTITQPKLLTKLFSLYPPRKDSAHIPSHPYPPLPKETDPLPQPTDHFTYLRLLGIQEPPGYNGRGVIRWHQEQQSHRSRPQ
jgi:hypothetical protein